MRPQAHTRGHACLRVGKQNQSRASSACPCTGHHSFPLSRTHRLAWDWGGTLSPEGETTTVGGDCSLREGLTFPVMSMAQPCAGPWFEAGRPVSVSDHLPHCQGLHCRGWLQLRRSSGGCPSEHAPWGRWLPLGQQHFLSHLA